MWPTSVGFIADPVPALSASASPPARSCRCTPTKLCRVTFDWAGDQ
jgi:hypothetical protein